jgi:Tfp pilus assembly protein PilV
MRLARETVVVVAVGLTGVVLLTGNAIGQGYVYPARGQSPQQQQQDAAECHVWATQQSGVNPAATTPPAPAAPPPQGQIMRGAGRGAAVGAVGGAIAGDAGKGAAIGAASGALIGGIRRRDQQQAAMQQQQAAQQAQAQATAAYNRANAACLEGRGYTVK